MTSTIGLPKMLPITASFAVPLTIGSVLLNWNVMAHRIATKTFIGSEAHTQASGTHHGKRVQQPDGHSYDPLLLATRIHGNYAENTPLVLLLAACAELSGANRKTLAYVLAAYMVIRVNHVIGLAQGVLPCRAVGAFGTMGLQLGLASWAGWCVKGYWGY